MAQNVTSGYSGVCNYGFETTFGTVASSLNRVFGYGVKVSTHSRKNNMKAVYGIGSRNAVTNVAEQYEGSVSFEFNLDADNSAWLRAVLGSAPTDAGSGPYTHTYYESNVLSSFSVVVGANVGTNEYVSTLIGVKVNTATITAAVNEPVTVKLDCLYTTETVALTGIPSQVSTNGTPLNFADGVLTVGGVTIGFVKSVELTVNNNLEMVWGLGSRYAVASVEKTRKYDVKLTAVFSDPTLLLSTFFGKTLPLSSTDLTVLNPLGVACVLTFDNGATGTASRKVVITLNNLYFNEHSLPLNVEDVITEDITAYALSCNNIVVTNNNTTDAGTP